MTGPKMASLASSLLARKGEARPATRRQFVAKTTIALLPLGGKTMALNDDGEWNEERDQPRAQAKPVVIRHLERLARSFRAPAEAARPEAPKVAFTLRLDHERHLRLRLARAVCHQSGQRIVIQALDEYLARLGASLGRDDIAAAFPEPEAMETRTPAHPTPAQSEARVRLFTDIADFLAEQPRTR